MEPIVITPKTKIHDLLEAYPELEDTLIKTAPQFKKLKNPLLRKTIARVTTLSQAAIIGGVNVEELINTLRESAGQEKLETYSMEETSYNYNQPDWFSSNAIRNKIEISDLLNVGEQPVHEVLAALKKLNADEILEIIAPFLPAPLIDKIISLGYRHWISQKGSEYCIYASKKT
jgi:hypothetical protein